MGIALIGAGLIAEESHLPAWSDEPRAQLRLVVDHERRRAERLAALCGADSAQDISAIANRGDIDAVDVCLPPHLHAATVIDLVKAGKHVLVEKPLATTVPDAEQVAHAAGGSERTVMVAENWPFSSAARQVAALVEDSRLGELFMLRAHHESALYVKRKADPRFWTRSSSHAGGGYLFDAGIHSVNLGRQLMGDWASVFALSTPDRHHLPEAVEDDIALVARSRTGGIISMSFTGRAQRPPPRQLSFVLFGSEGVVEWDILTGAASWTRVGERTDLSSSPPSMGFSEEISHFVDCILDGKEPLTSASDQVLTIATVVAAYRSMELGVPVEPSSLLTL
ncbi:MAG: Gfo/Idh/MocA family oxidoreductase [Chloroflexota bacterium]|nr:Gfo/Idh/MocA family oxidoreductase [Chloroflexota bacterium]